jgi:hypothetical protein
VAREGYANETIEVMSESKPRIFAWVVAISLFLAASSWGAQKINANMDNNWWLAAAPIILAAFIAGAVTRSYWSLWLSVVPMFLAMPYGYADEYSNSDSIQVFIVELFYAPVYLAAILAGVVIGRRLSRPDSQTLQARN